MGYKKILRIKLIILTSILLLFTSCSESLIKKDFENLKIFTLYDTDTSGTNYRIDLSNTNAIPVFEKYNIDNNETYIKVILDLKDAQNFRFIKNILNKNIEGYIVIKDPKGRDIARQKIVVYDDDLIEINKTRRHVYTGELRHYNKEEEIQRFTYDDTLRYLPQYVFINESLVFEDEIYILYIQGNFWKENKTTLMNICTSPKFISIESKDKIISFDKYFDSIKFFVTGYYRPSTKENLFDLELKIQEGKVNLPMDNITQMDRENVVHVEYAFDTLYKAAQKVFEIYIKSKKSEHLLIEFEGRTDPRLISAKYLEETVEFSNNDMKYPDMAIENGITMNNFILSQLRAYYTMKHIDAIFSKSIQYQQLNTQGRVHFRVIGSGPVDQSPNADQKEMALARRVEVRIIRIPPPEPDSQ